MDILVKLNDKYGWCCGQITPDDVQKTVELVPVVGDQIEAILMVASAATDAKGLLMHSTVSPTVALAILRVLAATNEKPQAAVARVLKGAP